MRHSIFLTILILVAFHTSAQSLNFHFERPLLTSVDSIEKNNGGQIITYVYPVSITDIYFPNATSYNLALPKVYKRESRNFSTEVSYFYSKPDSIVRLIEYSWDNKSKNTKGLFKLFRKNQKAIAKYFNDKGQVLYWVGKSISWKNDTTHVKQFQVNEQVTYRVRVLISWY